MMLMAPYYKAWDEEVLDAYIKYALSDIEGGEGRVRLKMDRFQVRLTPQSFGLDTTSAMIT